MTSIPDKWKIESVTNVGYLEVQEGVCKSKKSVRKYVCRDENGDIRVLYSVEGWGGYTNYNPLEL